MGEGVACETADVRFLALAELIEGAKENPL
jgi:hypothetical protein